MLNLPLAIMAKIRRNISNSDDTGKRSIRRKPIIPDRIRKWIPFMKPVQPSIEPLDPDISGEITDPENINPEETTPENTNPESTGTTGGSSSTDPGSTASTSTTPSDMEQMIGEIRMFAGNFAPRGWAFCEGQLLPISNHTALFSLIGTTYGGDGRTTFALPDLRGRVPMHQGHGVGLSDRRLGEAGGVEEIQLGVTNLPAHSHSVKSSQAAADSDDPTNKIMAQGSQSYGSPGQDSTMHENMISSSGGGLPHTNIQPYLAINFIIALEGIFPSRS